MLKVKITGDEHPKEITILTDDGDAELARMQEILNESEVEKDDPIRKALDSAEVVKVAEDKLGEDDIGCWAIEIPGENVAEAADLFEEWDAVYQAVEKLREESLAALEAASEEDDA